MEQAFRGRGQFFRAISTAAPAKATPLSSRYTAGPIMCFHMSTRAVRGFPPSYTHLNLKPGRQAHPGPAHPGRELHAVSLLVDEGDDRHPVVAVGIVVPRVVDHDTPGANTDPLQPPHHGRLPHREAEQQQGNRTAHSHTRRITHHRLPLPLRPAIRVLAHGADAAPPRPVAEPDAPTPGAPDHLPVLTRPTTRRTAPRTRCRRPAVWSEGIHATWCTCIRGAPGHRPRRRPCAPSTNIGGAAAAELPTFFRALLFSSRLLPCEGSLPRNQGPHWPPIEMWSTLETTGDRPAPDRGPRAHAVKND